MRSAADMQRRLPRRVGSPFSCTRQPVLTSGAGGRGGASDGPAAPMRQELGQSPRVETRSHACNMMQILFTICRHTAYLAGAGAVVLYSWSTHLHRPRSCAEAYEPHKSTSSHHTLPPLQLRHTEPEETR